ncbi:MAG: dienelactone hydrolase family protein [Aquabacterium sp.]
MKLKQLTLALAALSVSFLAATQALAAGFERGPAPTKAALEADRGSFEVASYKIERADAKAFGYGGATVYYPKSGTQTFGLVTVFPGFLGTQGVYATLAQRIASHGFVVANLDPNNIFDLPDLRARQMMAAQQQVIELAQGGAPYATVMDKSRRAVVGHSMGGGGTLSAASKDPSLKAAVPLTPWHTTKSFSANQVPTLIVACEKDAIAPNKQHSDPFYASLSPTLARGEVELKGADHLCPITLAKAVDQVNVAKSTIAWLKRFVDADMRYDGFIKNELNGPEYSRFEVKGF